MGGKVDKTGREGEDHLIEKKKTWHQFENPHGEKILSKWQAYEIEILIVIRDAMKEGY